MATFDQLSAEQRAIVELVLQQGKTYAELADMLGMPESRVRELARGALVELAPVSVRGVEDDWRGQLADYVLGQQSGPEATATKGHLRRSEAARSWTRSLLDSLEQLYSNGSLPAIPDGERGRTARPRREPQRPSSGRGFLGGLGALGAAMAGVALLLVLFAVLIWPVGVLTGDDEENGGRAQASPQGQNAGTGNINAQTRGQALIAEQGGRQQILVSATGLEPTTEGSAYQVWLYNSEQDRRSLGAQVTDRQGNFQASQRLPQNYQDFEFIDVTRVQIEGENLQTGESVLRGLLELRDEPITRGQGQNRVSLLGEIDLRPLPG